jgi:hypothetical protein
MTPLGTDLNGWFEEHIILLMARSLHKDAQTSPAES